MSYFKPKKEGSLPLFLTIMSYGLVASFGICFLLDRLYFSDYDDDWSLKLAYGQIISLGGLFVLWGGFFAYSYFYPEN